MFHPKRNSIFKKSFRISMQKIPMTFPFLVSLLTKKYKNVVYPKNVHFFTIYTYAFLFFLKKHTFQCAFGAKYAIVIIRDPSTTIPCDPHDPCPKFGGRDTTQPPGLTPMTDYRS